MGVDRAIRTRVLHNHDEPVTTKARAMNNTARFRGVDRRPTGGRHVEAFMRATTTHTKSRTQATAYGPGELELALLDRSLTSAAPRLLFLAR